MNGQTWLGMFAYFKCCLLCAKCLLCELSLHDDKQMLTNMKVLISSI